jgi:hypothetical protein
MPFIQIIEFTSSRFNEIEVLLDEWLEKTEGKRTATRGVITRDRDRQNTYVEIVEFPSYEEAMANSELPETTDISARLGELCESAPTFRNLDIAREIKA